MEQEVSAAAALPKSKVLDTIGALILAVASLVAAWNGYEATQWSSRQSEAASQSLDTRFAATRASARGEQRQLIDILTFSSWLDAKLSDDSETEAFYRAHFRSEFKIFFDAWMATEPFTNADAPINPFVMSDHVLEDLQRAEALEQNALELAEQAQEASRNSGHYITNTLFVSVALFFAGLTRSSDRRKIQIVMLAVAGAMLTMGIVNALRWPVA